MHIELILNEIRLIDSTTTSTKVSLTNNTGSSENIMFIVAAYSSNGRMITCDAIDLFLATGTSTELSIFFASVDEAAEVKAFVLTSVSLIPPREAWTRQLD